MKFVKIKGVLINSSMVHSVRIDYTPEHLDQYALVFNSTTGAEDEIPCENQDEADQWMVEFQREANDE